jgi:hypothetical protein
MAMGIKVRIKFQLWLFLRNINLPLSNHGFLGFQVIVNKSKQMWVSFQSLLHILA